MNVIEAIYGRRAVRAYDSRPVDEATIRKLLHAAVQAPSAMNAQPWLFAVVQDKKKLALLSDRAKTMLLEARGDAKSARYEGLLREPAFNIFYDAGTLIIIGAPPAIYAEADCWLAAEALMLAAYDAGIGTCPIGFAVGVLNAPDVRRDLGFPDDTVAVAPIIVGYPAAAAQAIPRAEPRVVSWLK
jgi:nitroreductase